MPANSPYPGESTAQFNRRKGKFKSVSERLEAGNSGNNVRGQLQRAAARRLGQRKGLPPGLANKPGGLPPGLAKKAGRGGRRFDLGDFTNTSGQPS